MLIDPANTTMVGTPTYKAIVTNLANTNMMVTQTYRATATDLADIKVMATQTFKKISPLQFLDITSIFAIYFNPTQLAISTLLIIVQCYICNAPQSPSLLLLFAHMYEPFNASFQHDILGVSACISLGGSNDDV
ncbi:hypothetical protein KP509_14G084500 [Ceratopteris richardii]|uniref:Uncharacterized protein n=1 Tax=Ceratopteris richardii TaxID=49495 RepID=A0A8T2TBJ6_CERRI|nr:hypothetical protein KP509_14G084500 [Ceratopteris richardii]